MEAADFLGGAMAAGVTFTRLSRGDLPELVEAAREDDPQAFAAFLAENGSTVADFDGDGEIFSVLLPVLCDEYDIDLETGENEIVADIAEAREGPVLILTLDDKEKYFELLNPDEFEEDELGDAYEDFTEEEDEYAGAAMLEAIAALYQALAEMDAGHVVVVTAG
jgi:predicted dehydrogenase